MKLPEWLKNAVDTIGDTFVAAVASIADMLKDLFYWLFDMLMTFAVGLLNGLAATLDFNPGQYISALSPELVNIMGLIRIGEAMTIIGSAIIIRLLLQLIPFVRLGS